MESYSHYPELDINFDTFLYIAIISK